MSIDTLWFGAFILLWLGLQLFVFPKLGIRT